MSERIELLKPVCSTDETRPALLAPFAAEFWGAKWAVGTNGRALAAFLSDVAPVVDGAPNIAAVLPAEVKPKGRTTLEALRAWAGEEVSQECENCNGAGYVDASGCGCPDCSGDHGCDECDGTGHCVEWRYGRLLDGVLNRNLLSKVLKSAPEGGEALVGHGDEWQPFILRAGDWMAAIMPIRPTTDEAKDTKEVFTALEPVGG